MTSQSTPNRHRLVLHVGFARVATTALQRHLHDHAGCYSDRGIGVLSPTGAADHNYLASQLAVLDGRGRPPSWHAVDKPTGRLALPSWDQHHTLLLSSEDFMGLGPGGRQRLRREYPHAQVTVIVGIRSPIAWMWSDWKQELRQGEVMTWVSHVERNLRERSLAQIVHNWSGVTGGDMVEFVSVDRSSPRSTIDDFLEAAAVERCRCSTDAPDNDALINASHTDLEHLYYPVLTRWVLHWCRVDHGMTSESERARIQNLVAQFSESRPCYEIAAPHQDQFTLDHLGLYDTGSNALVQDFAQRWALDVQDLLSGLQGPLSARSTAHLVRHLVECGDEIGPFTGSNSGPEPTFPAADFTERIPLDSHLLGVARVIARAVAVTESYRRRR